MHVVCVAVDAFAGFGISGYKSFADASRIEAIGPMGRIHLLVGKNNVGKSNALRAMHTLVSTLSEEPHRWSVAAKEMLQSQNLPEEWAGDELPRLSVALRVDDEFLEPVAKVRMQHGESGYNHDILTLFRQPEYSRTGDGVVWIDLEVVRDGPGDPILLPSEKQFSQAIGRIEDNRGFENWLRKASLETASSASSALTNYRNIISKLRLYRHIPETRWIDAIRELTASVGGDGPAPADAWKNGRGLIREISKLSRPSRPDRQSYETSKLRFANLTRLVRAVTEDPSAELEVPDDSNYADLLVHLNGRIMSVFDLGTGISELVVIAATVATTTGKLICIEEPEVHLHPTFQRRLIEYFSQDADNRYLISTHSAAILDSSIASISHLSTNLQGHTAVSPVVSRSALHNVVADLGNRASDLVQSNFVIWVEGPSDRLYIVYWLSIAAPDLIEGVHYSIMFYGGGLLNHLTAASDVTVDEFIQLAMINQNLAIVIDSDKKSEDDTLNETKQRVLSELASSDSVGWVTSGYTIENYMPRRVLTEAIAASYPEMTYVLPRSMYKSPLGRTFTGKNWRPNKVTIAKWIVAHGYPASVWPSDVAQHIRKIKAAIMKANHLE